MSFKANGYHIFRIAYFTFLTSMVILLLSSFFGLISFGIDGGNELTRIIIVVGSFLSLIIFAVINSYKNEKFILNFIRVILIGFMLLIIFFLINDAL